MLTVPVMLINRWDFSNTMTKSLTEALQGGRIYCGSQFKEAWSGKGSVIAAGCMAPPMAVGPVDRGLGKN